MTSRTIISCNHCGNQYKTKTNLNKHIVLCGFLYNARNKPNYAEEQETLPTPKIMYQLLLDLAIKYNSLEDKMTDINKWVAKKKKKFNVIDWLNTTVAPLYPFDNLHEHITITPSHVEFIFKNSFYETFNCIISTMIDNNDGILPIYAFIQKPNSFYIWDNTQWIELTRDKLIRFLNILQHKMSKGLFEWKTNHKRECNEDDTMATTYDKAIIKLMSVNFNHDATTNKIKSLIFSKIKTDCKTLIEHEYEF
jgi:hypothetical protein